MEKWMGSLREKAGKNRNILFDVAAGPSLLVVGGGTLLVVVAVVALVAWAIVRIVKAAKKK